MTKIYISSSSSDRQGPGIEQEHEGARAWEGKESGSVRGGDSSTGAWEETGVRDGARA